MQQSIQVFKYSPCPTIAEIYKELSEGKIMPRECEDETNPNKMIELKTIFSKVKKTPDGIGGTIEHEFQQKLKYGDDDQFDIVHPAIEFFIIPVYKILILHGPEDIRDRVYEIVEKAISNGTDYIKPAHMKKDEMRELVDNILHEHDSNKINLHKNKNVKTDEYGIEDRVVKMHKGKCATKIPKFEDDFEKATSFHTRLELVKCGGLINEIEKSGYLNINDNMAFSFSRKRAAQQWNNFILQKCKILFN